MNEVEWRVNDIMREITTYLVNDCVPATVGIDVHIFMSLTVKTYNLLN